MSGHQQVYHPLYIPNSLIHITEKEFRALEAISQHLVLMNKEHTLEFNLTVVDRERFVTSIDHVKPVDEASKSPPEQFEFN